MRFALVFLSICAFAWAVPTTVENVVEGAVVADKEFLEKQKVLLLLFDYVNQPSFYQSHVEIASTYDPEHNVANYEKPEFVEEFFHYYHHNILKRDEIFSVYNDQHIQQAVALFHVFYHAKDFDTFYKTAVWARQHVNQGLFLYTFSVAIAHRPDTYGIVIPPIYEVYPFYFFNKEVIHQAQQYKQVHHAVSDKDVKPYVIHANYSGHYLNLHPQQSMSYYLEDVGINSFYWYYNIFYPYWMDGKSHHLDYHHRGEHYYFVHQQLLARYYLERLSEHWDEIPYFNWDVPFETGYYPSLQYPNGLDFPTRPNFAKLHEYFYNYGQRWSWKSVYGYSYQFVNDFERRIVDAIQLGYVYNVHGEKIDLYSEEGLNILGNLIEGNADSVHYRYYGGYDHKQHRYHNGYVHFARHLLGYAPQPLDQHHVAPSALEHFETSLRDPAFYQLYKKITVFFSLYKYNLGPYGHKDLSFDYLKVKHVEVDRLVTYFEDFEADITNAVYLNKEDTEHENFHVQVRQKRLNHKPYTYKIDVHSDKDTKVSVRVFLGPKYDEYGRHLDLNENRFNFVLLDHFVHDVKAGDNVITRHSNVNYHYQQDRTSGRQLYKKVLSALEGSDKFYVGGNHGHEFYYGFPQRYALPKGNYEGVDYQFYFVVSPYTEYHHEANPAHQHSTYAGHFVDGYSLGYPFDRPIVEQEFYSAPNIYSYHTKIYHRTVEDINATTADH